MPSIKDFLFGSDPEVESRSRLTPQQEQGLTRLLGQLDRGGRGVGGGPEFEGSLTVDPSSTQQESLAALEQRVLQRATGQDPLTQAATQALIGLITTGGSPTDQEDFFRTNIEQPALESFEGEIRPNIGRTFGGSSFFGSERREADEAAVGELIDSLTRSRSELAFRGREAATDRLLQALGLSSDLRGQETNELLSLFGAGGEITALDERNVGREFAEFGRQQDERSRRIQEMLAALGIQATDTVVTPGSSGLVQQVAGAVAGGGAQALGAVGAARLLPRLFDRSR